MAVRIFKPIDVVSAPDLTISEYVGRVASSQPELSACVATVRKATEEAFQCPDFAEYVLVLEGAVTILEGATGERTTIEAGSGFYLPAKTRVALAVDLHVSRPWLLATLSSFDCAHPVCLWFAGQVDLARAVQVRANLPARLFARQLRS